MGCRVTHIKDDMKHSFSFPHKLYFNVSHPYSPSHTRIPVIHGIKLINTMIQITFFINNNRKLHSYAQAIMGFVLHCERICS